MSQVLQTHFQRIEKNIPQYPFTVEKFNKILKNKRLNACQNDCVVNALEIIDVLTQEEAGKKREEIKNKNLLGIIGLQADEFIEILDEVNPNYNHILEHIHMEGPDGLINWIKTKMLPGRMIFCAFKSYDGVGHVYMIGKLVTTIVLIDPQKKQPICDLDIVDCLQTISGQAHYFVLTRIRKEKDVEMKQDDVEMKQEDDVEMKQGMKQRMKNPINLLKSKMYKKYSMRC